MSINNHPVVSVVIPTHNRERLVGRAIRSVLGQTYTNLELIVVDDGSTDNTARVVSSFDDPRLRFVRHEQNRGVSASRNTGIRMSRGEYVAFQDSDDEWLPQKLEKQLDVFVRTSMSGLGVVACGKLRLSADGTNIVERRMYNGMKGQIYEDLLALRWEPGTQVLLIKKDYLHDNMFDERIRAHEDWELCLRLSKRCQFDSINEPLVLQYEHAGPRASAAADSWKISLYCIEKYKKQLEARPKAYARHRFDAFNGYYDAGLLTEARGELVHSLRLDPWQPKRLATLVTLTVSPKFMEFSRHTFRLMKGCFRSGNGRSSINR